MKSLKNFIIESSIFDESTKRNLQADDVEEIIDFIRKHCMVEHYTNVRWFDAYIKLDNWVKYSGYAIKNVLLKEERESKYLFLNVYWLGDAALDYRSIECTPEVIRKGIHLSTEHIVNSGSEAQHYEDFDINIPASKVKEVFQQLADMINAGELPQK